MKEDCDFDKIIYKKNNDGSYEKLLVELNINTANEMSEKEVNDVISFLEEELDRFKNDRSLYFKCYFSSLLSIEQERLNT